ncbi:MAG: tetratricopeptide repeat protein [Myxococcota bacterium]
MAPPWRDQSQRDGSRGNVSSLATASAFLVLVACLGCDSAEQRIATHLARAKSMATEPPPGATAAILELRNALALAPGRPDLHFEIARILEREGRRSDAIVHYEETLFFDPEDAEAATRLARLLSERRPLRANELIAGVLAAHPDHAEAWAAQAQLNTDAGNFDEALDAARRSLAANPELARGHWALGRALLAQLLDDRGRGNPLDPERFAAIQETIERYREHMGNDDRWSVLPERARLFGLWPGHEAEAGAAWRDLIDQTSAADTPLHVSKHSALVAFDLARDWNDEVLQVEALERLAEIEPDNLAHWDQLVALRDRGDSSGRQALLRLLEARPEDPEAHLRFATHLRAREGRNAAIAYLEDRIDDERMRPQMLGALIELRQQAGESAAAAALVAALEDDYPFLPITLRVKSHLAMRAGRVDQAAALLRRLVAMEDRAEPVMLLAYAESSRRDYPATLDAIARAVERDPALREALLPLRAHAFSQSGQCERAVRDFGSLYRDRRLDDHQKRLYARCLYQVKKTAEGRAVLLDALQQPDASTETLIELASREVATPSGVSGLRDSLHDAYQREPQRIDLLTLLAAHEHRLGETAGALERLDAAYAGGNRDPALRQLRARLLAHFGRHAEARDELEDLFRTRPDLEKLLPQLIATLVALDDRSGLVAALTRGERYGLLGAQRFAMLGNLLLEEGDPSAARRAFERALKLGLRTPRLKIQLALILADEDENLETAEKLARSALASGGDPAAGNDALGAVLLRQGRNFEAVRSFRQALRASPQRPASTRYRLALALFADGKIEEAENQLARARELDPDLPARLDMPVGEPPREKSGS